MFCCKCGAALPEGTKFCQKCGTKLIQENTSEHETAPASKDTSEIYTLLEANAGMQPKIKSVKHIKNSVSLHCRINDYIVAVNNSQAHITSLLTFPISLLYGLPFGVLCYISSTIGWTLMEHGSLSLEDYALPIVILLFTGGLITAFAPLLGTKEKKIVTEYVRGIVEPEGISLTAKKGKPAIRYLVSILLILIAVPVLLFGVLDIELDSGGFGSGRVLDDGDNVDNYRPNSGESISLTQTCVNEEEGFSFKYPYNWEIEDVDEIDPDALVSVACTGGLGTYARILVTKYIDDGSLFISTTTDFEEAYSYETGIRNLQITELTDMELDGHPARKLAFMCNNAGPLLNYIQYFYIRDSYVYCVTCVVEATNYDSYVTKFSAIMDSYKIFAENTPNNSAITSIRGDDNELYYGEILLTDLLDKNANEVRNILGDPTSGTPVTGELLFGGTEYYEYDGLALYFDNQTGRVDSISILPALVKFNGITLNKNKTDLIRLLGQPAYEDYYHDTSGEFDDYYYLQYSLHDTDAIFQIEMPDADKTANYVNIYKYIDEPNDDWNEDYESTFELDYGLAWVEMPYSATDGLGFDSINGVIENTSGFTKDWVIIYFNLYDINGYLIGDTSASIQNLKNGDKWKFSAVILDDDAAYWDFSYISVY